MSIPAIPLLNLSRVCCKRACDAGRDLCNKVTVVTGGADGIGYEIAHKYLKHGAKLAILLDINEKLGKDAVDKLIALYGPNKAVFMKCDVASDADYISQQILSCYNVDILVNNAGLLDENDPRRVIDININGAVEFALKFWECWRQDKGGCGGSIINLSSIYGYRVDPFFPVYKCTKYALMGFTKCLGHPMNYQRSGVSVMAVCPGFTKTAMTSEPILWDPTFTPQFKKYVKKQLWQPVDCVGDASVQVYQKCPSGTAWVIEGSKPIFSV